MNRVQPPDVLLVKLLRRSDAPTDEDILKLCRAVELRVAENAMSQLTIQKEASARWLVHERLTGILRDARAVLRTLVLIGISSVLRIMVKVRLLSSRLSLQ